MRMKSMDHIPWQLRQALVEGWGKKWFRNFAQGDKWIFCLTAGTLVPANQERP